LSLSVSAVFKGELFSLAAAMLFGK
ncbi:hypothetical protein VCHENC02_5242B, partial [Vibrio harveyi]